MVIISVKKLFIKLRKLTVKETLYIIY